MLQMILSMTLKAKVASSGECTAPSRLKQQQQEPGQRRPWGLGVPVDMVAVVTEKHAL